MAVAAMQRSYVIFDFITQLDLCAVIMKAFNNNISMRLFCQVGLSVCLVADPLRRTV